MSDARRIWLATVGAVTAIAVLYPASGALGRHNFSMLVAEPREVAAGGEVTVRGFSYTDEVTIRFGALDGPVLARLEPDANEDIEGVVRIPADAPAGRHILFAFQEDASGRIARIPARAAVLVGDTPLGDPLEPEVEPRSAGLLEREGLSLGELAVVALATVGAAALLAAAAAGVVLSRVRRRAAGARR